MTETGQEQVTEPQGQEVQGNPAWSEFLSVIPEDLHSQVTPVLQKWDQGVQERFEKVQSEYADYKPFKESGISTDELNRGLNLYYALQENPQQVLDAIAEWMGQDPTAAPKEQPKPQTDQGQQPAENPLTGLPEFQQMNQMVNQIAQYIVTQQNQSEQNAEDEKITQEFFALEQKIGREVDDYEVSQIMSHMLANNSTVDQAWSALEAYQNKILEQSRKPAPIVLGGGGSFPTPNVSPEKMSDADRRNLVAASLQAMAAQNQG